MKKISYILIIVLTAAFFMCTDTFAQDSESKIPMLDGRPFVVNNFIPSPFVRTELSSGLGFASSIETEIPLLRLDSAYGSNKKIKADITYVNGKFNFQYAPMKWASLFLTMSAIARLGTNTASIFASGITANTSFQTGMLFRLAEWKKSMISSAVNVRNTGSTRVDIYTFVKPYLDTTLEHQKLINSYNPLSGSVDLRGAFSPSAGWSILGYLEGGYGELIDNELKNKFYYTVAGTFNFNLNDKSHIPISFGAGFKLNSNSPTLEYVKRLTQSYLFQIAYTGRKDFLLDVEANYLRIPSRNYDLTLNLTSYSFNWVYYF